MPIFYGKILLLKYLTFAGKMVYNYSIMGSVFKKNKKKNAISPPHLGSS